MKMKYPPFTLRDAYMHERRDFGKVKPYTKTIKSKKDYDRKVLKNADRKRFASHETD